MSTFVQRFGDHDKYKHVGGGRFALAQITVEGVASTSVEDLQLDADTYAVRFIQADTPEQALEIAGSTDGPKHFFATSDELVLKSDTQKLWNLGLDKTVAGMQGGSAVVIRADGKNSSTTRLVRDQDSVVNTTTRKIVYANNGMVLR